MKLVIYFFIFSITPFLIFSQDSFLTVSSKDSINEKPKFKSSLGIYYQSKIEMPYKLVLGSCFIFNYIIINSLF